MFRIACVCGHEAPFDEFTSTAAGFDTPEGTFQCRVCFRAWAIRKVGVAQVFSDGFVIPAKRAVVPVQGVL